MDDTSRKTPHRETTDTSFGDPFSSTSSQTHPLAYELVGLQRVVNYIRLYGLDHERSWQQSDQLLKRLTPMLEELGSLTLKVTDGTLLFGDTKVVEEGDRGGLVDELFRDGIRQLTLKKGIEVDEFMDLLSILGTNFHLPRNQEDTLQGLLWAADLPHVGYEAVKGIEEAVEDSADAGRGEHVDFDEICDALVGRLPNAQGLPRLARWRLSAFRRSGTSEEDGVPVLLPTEPDLPPWEDDDDTDPPAKTSGGSTPTPSGDPDEQAAPPADDGSPTDEDGGEESTADRLGDEASLADLSPLGTIDFIEERAEELGVSPDELLQLWEEAESESLATLLDRCISILIHAALFEAPGADLDRFAPLIEQTMKQAAPAGLVSRYRSTVEMMAGIVEAEEGLDESPPADRLLKNLLQIDLLLEFAASVDPEDAGAAKHIQQVIELDSARLTQGILEHIPEAEDPAFRRFLIQRVVTEMQGDPRPLTEGLRKLDLGQMRIRLELLARMDSYVARDMLTSLLEHPDAAVRIAAIELIPSNHVRHVWKRLAQRLADDGDPGVRAAVIHRMETEKLPALAPLLHRMVSAESFHQRPTEEKEFALAVLVRTGAEEGVKALTDLMNAKASLMHPRHGETRRLSATALGASASPRAKLALQRATKSWDPGLRRAASNALAGGRRK